MTELYYTRDLLKPTYKPVCLLNKTHAYLDEGLIFGGFKLSNINVELPRELTDSGVGKTRIHDNDIMIEYRKTDYRFTLNKNDIDATEKAFHKKMGEVIENPIVKQHIISLFSGSHMGSDQR